MERRLTALSGLTPETKLTDHPGYKKIINS
jgi:hypothetical protein